MLLNNTFLNVVILINLTLIAGILPLIERKYLSLIQRRVGPTFVGYRGRLQFIADALKMFLKGCLIPNKANNFYFLFYPSIFLTVCYLFWLNTYWSYDLIFFELEYNLVYLNIISLFINFFIILTGIYSYNKYTLLSSLRTIGVMFCLELLLGLVIQLIIILSHTLSFTNVINTQQELYNIFIFFIIYASILITTMVEINRSPFDLNEAESELISGFHVEYGAFFFGLFYLGEYFHLFFFSTILNILFLGLF